MGKSNTKYVTTSGTEMSGGYRDERIAAGEVAYLGNRKALAYVPPPDTEAN